jgi:hypothetical protein
MPATNAASRAIRCSKGMNVRVGRKKPRQYYTFAAGNGKNRRTGGFRRRGVRTPAAAG